MYCVNALIRFHSSIDEGGVCTSYYGLITVFGRRKFIVRFHVYL